LVREVDKMGFRDLIDMGALEISYHITPRSRARKPSRNVAMSHRDTIEIVGPERA
jgi:hypothetical protein